MIKASSSDLQKVHLNMPIPHCPYMLDASKFGSHGYEHDHEKLEQCCTNEMPRGWQNRNPKLQIEGGGYCQRLKKKSDLHTNDAEWLHLAMKHLE